MRSDLVKCGERVDDLQNGLFVIQDPKKFCFGMDAVLLSGFARVKKGEVALDMGTGTGIIPILLSDRTDGEHFTGLEIQHECAEMADRSVRYNGLEDRVRIVEGDIKEAAGIFGADVYGKSKEQFAEDIKDKTIIVMMTDEEYKEYIKAKRLYRVIKKEEL